jgi:phospholipase/lecithinase/hemolysin
VGLERLHKPDEDASTLQRPVDCGTHVPSVAMFPEEIAKYSNYCFGEHGHPTLWPPEL